VSAPGTFGVATVTFMVLALAILSSRLDLRLSEQSKAVRASEQRYQLLFHRSLAGVYQSTLDGELLDCNDALARILGYASRTELMARQANELYSAPEHRAEWVRRLQADKALANFECQLKTKDGETIWVLESATLVAGSAGRPAVAEGTIIDITRRKKAEEEVAAMTATLLASVERYRLLVESTSAVPWEWMARRWSCATSRPRIVRKFLILRWSIAGFPLINMSAASSMLFCICSTRDL
jgi:PAS domain S-box-containing protein